MLGWRAWKPIAATYNRNRSIIKIYDRQNTRYLNQEFDTPFAI
jgi:hypothetical protein